MNTFVSRFSYDIREAFASLGSAPASFSGFSHSFALCKSSFCRKTPNLGKSIKGAQDGQSPDGL